VWEWYLSGRDGDGGVGVRVGKVRYNSDNCDGQVYTHHGR